MSDIDLTEAVEAAQDDLTRTFGKAVRAHRSEPAVDLADGSTVFPHPIAQALVEKAAPLIERQVREQIARDIERLAAQLDARSITYQTYTERAVLQVKREGVDEAARIARGGAS